MRGRGLPPAGLAVVLAIAVAGCGHGAAPSGAANPGEAADLGRHLVVHRPAGVPRSRRVALVLALHGRGQSPERMAALTGMNPVADRFGFVAAYPSSGSKRGWHGASWSPRDDIVYLRRLIDQLIAQGGINRRRVYVVGFSSGGSMAYRVGCQLASRVAGIGVVSAAMGVTRCRPARHLSVFSIAGDSDPYIPIHGTDRITSPARTSARWARINRCRRRGPIRSTGAVERRTWRRCRGRRQVMLAVIHGGVHAWPGGPEVSDTSPDNQLDASTTFWRFLSRFRRLRSSRP